MSTKLIDFRKMTLGAEYEGTKIVTCPVCKLPGLGFTYTKVSTIRYVHTAMQEPVAHNEGKKFSLFHRAYHSTVI